MAKQIRWYKVADSIDAIAWQNNQLAVVEAGGRTVTIAKINKDLFACAYRCPHASGILADGFIDAVGNIVCPLHRYKFSLHNGCNVSGEGYYLRTYPVEMREAGIFVGFEEAGWMNLFK